MRILLDECLDWRLRRDLADLDVKTVRQVGWTAIENGALLKLAEREFDVLVTVDKNLSFQQNLAGFRLYLECLEDTGVVVELITHHSSLIIPRSKYE